MIQTRNLSLLGLSFTLLLGACGAPRSSQAALQSVNFSCRLPVGSNPVGAGGFVEFPSGRFVADAGSQVSYDPRSERWLPVSRSMVSPDGTSYIRIEYSKPGPSIEIHIVDAATGKDRALWREDSIVLVLGWTSDGAYFVRPASSTGTGPQLWLLDPGSGRRRMVASDLEKNAGFPLFKAWSGMAEGAAWSKTVANTRPSSDVLVRINLADGRASAWFNAGSATTLDVLGWDGQGRPYLAIGQNPVRVALLEARDHARPIASNGFSWSVGLSDNGVQDDHGFWVTGESGSIWLFAGTGGLKRVAKVPVPPAAHPGSDMPGITQMFIAGPCS